MNAQPAILSVAVLASFALAIGGGWLVAKRRDRRRGVLMIVMALVLLANILLWALPVPAHAAAPALPPDAVSAQARLNRHPSGSWDLSKVVSGRARPQLSLG